MIRSAPYYWVTCDLCGVSSTDRTAWPDEESAVLSAQDDLWHVENGNHLCGPCVWACTSPEDAP